MTGSYPTMGASLTYALDYVLGGEKWWVPNVCTPFLYSIRIMEVRYNQALGFVIVLRAPESVKTFTYKPYARTNDKDIQYGAAVNVVAQHINNLFSYREPGWPKVRRL